MEPKAMGRLLGIVPELVVRRVQKVTEQKEDQRETRRMIHDRENRRKRLIQLS